MAAGGRVAGWRVHVGVIVAYAVVSLVLSWPLPLHLSTHLTGDPGGDTGIYVWNLWVFRHELLLGHNPFYTSTLFALTSPADLTLHNYTIFTDVLSLPLQSRLGLIETFNVLYLGLGVLNAYAMFLLARHLCGSATAAWLAGLLFAFSPFLTARGTAHFSLVAAAPLPIFLLFLLKAEKTRQARYALGAGLSLAWALYCDPYYAVFCLLLAIAWLAPALLHITFDAWQEPRGGWLRALEALALVLGALVAWIAITGGGEVVLAGLRIGLHSLHTPVLLLVLVLGARVVLGLRPSLRLRQGLPLRAWAALGALGVVSAAVGLLPFLHALATRIAERDFVSPPIAWRSSPRGVDAMAFFIPNPSHRLFGRPGRQWLRRERADGFPENAAALTLVAPALIVAGFWRRRKDLPGRWALLALFFGLLSLGPFIWIAGVNTRVPTPWTFLRYVPVIGLVRSPGRFAVVVMLAVSVLAAMALAHVIRQHGRGRLIAPAVGAALLFELAPLPRPLYSAEIPRVYRRIAGDPRDVRVLELPTGLRDGTSSTGNYSARAQFHQTLHGKPLVGGYLSRVSSRRVLASRRHAVLDALFTLSAGERLSPRQRRRAFAAPERFVRRLRLGYVVIDSSRASPRLRRFAINLLALEQIDEDGAYELYRPDPTRLTLRAAPGAHIASAASSLPDRR